MSYRAPMTFRPLTRPLLFALALSLAACAGNNNRQLADLQVELRAERELLKETRAELQALIRELEPLLAAAESKNEFLREALSNETSEDETSPAELIGGASFDGITKIDPTHVKITRAAWNSLFDDPIAMARAARLVPSLEGGKPNGLRLFGIRPSSILAALGFQNGDTIHRVNGADLDGMEKLLEIYVNVHTESHVTLELTRRGKAMTLNYVIQ